MDIRSPMKKPPAIDGVSPSRYQLPSAHWPTVLDALCERFASVTRAAWLDRFARGRVLGEDGAPITSSDACKVGMEIHYYREVSHEATCAEQETVLHVDADLVVVDKPHFLAAVPSGPYVRDTLLARLTRRFGNTDLVPLHRLDRLTAGLMLFSARHETRGLYQSLFRERAIHKEYEAIAAPLPHLQFPHRRESRIERGEPFFRMRECEGDPNSVTDIDIISRGESGWRYRLRPITGRKHQLRIHLAALGAPISGDPLYPLLRAGEDSPTQPLRLLARSLRFVDPIDGRTRIFLSDREL